MTTEKKDLSKFPSPHYFRLDVAAGFLGITEDNLLHYGAIGAVDLLTPITNGENGLWSNFCGFWVVDDQLTMDYFDLDDESIGKYLDKNYPLLYKNCFVRLSQRHCQLIELEGYFSDFETVFPSSLLFSFFRHGLYEFYQRGIFYNGKKITGLVFSNVKITKNNLFIANKDLVKMSSGGNFPREGISPEKIQENEIEEIEKNETIQKKMGNPRSQPLKSACKVIAALLTNRNADSLRDLERVSALGGYSVSKSTIGNVMCRVKDIVPNCPSLKDE